ncbi:E3 ubiquitin-protein ligase PDZRN3-like [Lineus longissimus]|uniref:E3 ubiquitin-protein ligase PDZRN3-like n=1 Tax=Lineus longissimus TaxID=88925 RepID=UPI00315C507D
MGLDVKLFKGTVDEDLICPVCNGVFVDPVTPSCQHIVCSGCVRTRLRRGRDTCIVCEGKLVEKNGKPPQNLSIKLLTLDMNCVNGCGKIVHLGELPDHVSDECPNAMLLCPNRRRGCQSKINRKDVNKHMEHCLYRFVHCEACGCRTMQFDLFTHQRKKGCLALKLRQDVMRSRRASSAAIKLHRLHLKDVDIEAHQETRRLVKERTCSASSSRLSTPMRRGSTGRWSETTCGTPDSLDGEISPSGCSSPRSPSAMSWRPVTPVDDSTSTCMRCDRVFKLAKNGDRACQWHLGVSWTLHNSVRRSSRFLLLIANT